MSKESILIVDPEPSLLVKATDRLHKDGYTINTVNTGQDALSLITKKHFDLLLVDPAISGTNGIELIKQAHLIAPDIITGIITHNRDSDVIRNSVLAGAQVILIKPFTAKELLNEVKKAIRKNRLIKEDIKIKTFIPLVEINKYIASESDFNKIVDYIVRVISQETASDSVSLMFIDKESGRLASKAAITANDTIINRTTGTVNETIADRVAHSGKPVVLNGNIEGTCQHSDPSIFSILCIPIILRGKTIGVINCCRKKSKRKFTESEFNLITLIASQVATAIETTSPLTDLEIQQNKFDTLVHQFILAQENERTRISSTLHDTIAQWMVSVSYHSQTCHSLITQGKTNEAQEEASHIVDIIDECVKEIRRMISNLHPIDLKELGLIEALHHFIDNFSYETNINCNLRIEGDQDSSLPWTHEISIYRLVLDLLNSIREGNNSDEIELYLKFDSDQTTLVLWDSGTILANLDLTMISKQAELFGWYMSLDTDSEIENKVVFRIPVSSIYNSLDTEDHDLLTLGSGGK